AVSVLLDGGYLDVVVILPEDFSAFEDALDAVKLAEVLGGLNPTELDLRLPKLTLRASFELTSELKELGMLAPFADSTSFDAIHPDIDTLDVVVQQTVIMVDEDGIEAAAATGIGGDG